VNLLANAGSSTNIGSSEAGEHYGYRTLGRSPTEQVPLHNNKSRMILPNLAKQQFVFGTTDGRNGESTSDMPQVEQQVGRHSLGSDAKLKLPKRGIHSKMFAGKFKATDIERNSVLSFGVKQLQDLQKSREDMHSVFQGPVSAREAAFHRRHNSTVDG